MFSIGALTYTPDLDDAHLRQIPRYAGGEPGTVGITRGTCVQGESEAIPEGSARRGSGSRRLVVIVFGLACLIAAGSWIAYGRQAKTQQQARETAGGTSAAPARPIPVVVASVPPATCPSISGLGTITAFNTVTVKSRVDGQIVRWHFPKGRTSRPETSSS